MTKIAKLLLLVLGVIMFFGSLWVTPYFLHTLGSQHWIFFPLVMTGIVSNITGFFAVGISLIKLSQVE